MRGAWETPDEPCPYCGRQCQAEFVNVGVGMVQCAPYVCECGAYEIGPYDDYVPNEIEKRTGWYEPPSPVAGDAT